MKKKQLTFDFLTEEEVSKGLRKTLVKQTKEYFIKFLYKELFDELKKTSLLKDIKQATVFNSSSPLTEAIKTRRVVYINGVLKGTFSVDVENEIKLLGGVWNKSLYGYQIAIISLPKEAQGFVINGKIAQTNLLNKLTPVFMAGVATKIISQFTKNNYTPFFNNILTEAENRVYKQTGISKSILDKNEFVKQYTQNMLINIKGFVQDDVEKIRKDVLDTISKGGSHKQVKSMLENRYHVNQTRAKQIADGETRLALTTFQQNAFKENNQDEFYWIHPDPSGETSRPVHTAWFEESKKGKTFSFKNPPINPDTNQPDTPGILYGCRCKARVVLKENPIENFLKTDKK